MSTSPVITSITFDQESYAPGTTITATVAYASGTADMTETFTGTATSGTGQTGALSVTFTTTEPDSAIVTVTDTGGRVWAKTMDDGTSAVFTATA